MWSAAFDEYKAWALNNNFLTRDAEKVKAKFDRLAQTKKNTGNPTCPPLVPRAKHIARAILTRAHTS